MAKPQDGAPLLQHLPSQPENPFAYLTPNQSIAVIPSFTLESGVTIHNVPIAYKTYGSLSPSADNAMVICHALTGSADVGDWWGPLLGIEGKAFDMSRFFVVCMNSLGSPYGSASPVTAKNGEIGAGVYGPEFPLTTVRDDVNLFKLILDDLGVKQIAAVIGGSMGGMLVLEFAYFGKDYVKTIIPIATSARYSAWGISWGEAQRQSIYSDPKYEDGYYASSDPPSTGLGAARMQALLTYRSRDSFESRFGRNTPDPLRKQNINGEFQRQHDNEHFAIHNEGHRNAGSPRPSRVNSAASVSTPSTPLSPAASSSSGTPAHQAKKRAPTYFSAQSYLRYQGQKFIARFDANCYIAITRKLDTHDISRGRVSATQQPVDPVEALMIALGQIEQPTLILGIQSDGLFTFAEQQELAKGIPNAVLKTIDSPEGHDAFLLEFEQVNKHLVHFLQEQLPGIYAREPVAVSGGEGGQGFDAVKSSVFGEVEVEDKAVPEVEDITAW
ncbi:homoserine o-acetyltransferas-like protein [Aulographum hederae CBS 113979]|uniref:Homoserine o-acetyltransferas-like protein n=1 Tax=Aulographum hederae CBS 113979 TaxID=1176131 RepID=A0A6G1HD06_9PEZI|nr:homoserine o-acetyltransferas-like protein [Aulographum hederae CBS 113979]